MLRRDSKVKEIWGRQFRIVRKGLDEAEVFAFISRLIEQNSELSRKLEHVDSLKRLAENAVIEASKQAESIKIETREEADRKAEEIITQAVEQTKAEAKRIIAEAEKSSRDRIAASEQLAQDMLKAAEEKARAQAEKIIAEAEEKAEAQAGKIIAEAEEKARAQAEGQTKAEVERIIAEAEEKARAQAEGQARAQAERIIAEAERSSLDRIVASEQLAQDMLRAAEEKAEAQPRAEKLAQEKLSVAEQEAAPVRREAGQLLPASKRIAESEIREITRRVLGEFLSSPKDIEKTTTSSREGESKAPQPSRTEAVVHGPAGTVGGELQGETSLGEEEGDEKEGPALYRGVVEVAIPPPVAMSNMLKLHRQLTGTRQISVLDVSGSAGKGIIIKLFLRSPTPLIDMLENLPQVYEVAVAKKQANNTHPPQHRPNEAAAIRIILTLRK